MGCSGPCIPAMHILSDKPGAITAVRTSCFTPFDYCWLWYSGRSAPHTLPLVLFYSCPNDTMFQKQTSRPSPPPYHITDELFIVYYSVLASFKFHHFRTVALNITNILLNIVVYIIPGSFMRALLSIESAQVSLQSL